MASGDDVLDLSVRELLEQVAARTPAPGAGSAAALVLGLAAGLASMAARFASGHWDGATHAVERADALRLQAEPLAGADADSYTWVLEAYRVPREPDPAVRAAAIAAALVAATAVPLEIAEIAAKVAGLAAEVAEHGNTNLRGDAAAGAVLAEASARVAAALVAINLSARPDDGRVARAAELVTAAAESSGRALRAAE